VRFLSNALGQVTDTYDYDAFGELLSVNGTTPNSFMYCGEQYDADLGLYYLRARLMNPLTGRFWTADSYEGMNEDPATLHKYMYASGDGVNGIDPSGYLTLTEHMMVASIVATLSAVVSVKVTQYLNPDATEADLWKAAGWGGLIGLLSYPAFMVAPGVAATAPLFIAALRIITLAGLTLDSTVQAIYAASEKERRVFAAFAVLGALGTYGATRPFFSPKGIPVPADLPKTIFGPKQEIHTTGPTLLEGRSPLTANAQALLDGVHSGEFPIIRLNPRGQPVVNFGKEVGIHAESGLPTQFGTILYGKKGAHIVPANPVQY